MNPGRLFLLVSPFFFSIFPYVIPLFLQILLPVKTRFNALQRRRDYESNRHCIISEYEFSGTILGAVAELERENIIAQNLLGREEKAKSGGWNGGFAPYGYRLVKGDDKSKGKLETVPEEKAVVQLVFDMFLNRNMGYTAISGYLNRNGYTRPPAKNAIRPSYGEWSSDHIKRMLSNPIYTGRVAWGKRRTESYVCSYATKHRGTSVCRRNGVIASQVEDEVMEYTRKIVRNPQFIKDLQEKVMAAVDMTEFELFPREEQKTQKRFVKAIAYKFPIEQKVLTQFDECGASVETVALLEK